MDLQADTSACEIRKHGESASIKQQELVSPVLLLNGVQGKALAEVPAQNWYLIGTVLNLFGIWSFLTGNTVLQGAFLIA